MWIITKLAKRYVKESGWCVGWSLRIKTFIIRVLIRSTENVRCRSESIGRYFIRSFDFLNKPWRKNLLLYIKIIRVILQLTSWVIAYIDPYRTNTKSYFALYAVERSNRPIPSASYIYRSPNDSISIYR